MPARSLHFLLLSPAINYFHAPSLANMPVKVLKPTTVRKKAMVATLAVRTMFVEVVEAVDAALET
jgi:hypothetical protein